MDRSCIPVVIGITGHRDLCPEQEASIRKAVREQLVLIQKACRSSEIVMLSALAAGADMLCAEEALKLGIRLICPLPMPAGQYENDFSSADRLRFRALLKQAEKTFPVCSDGSDRSLAYRKCGQYIADHCHILMALWNGDSSLCGSVGTAAIVHYAQYGSFPDSQELRLGSRCSILHITVGRAGSAGLPASEVGCRWLIEASEMLRITDQFNRDSAAAEAAYPPPLSNIPDLPPSVKRLQQLYQAADSLSVQLQKNYLHALLAMAVFCVMLVLSYLLYDELDCRAFLILYGGIMAVYALSYLRLNRSSIMDRHLRYRMLAEAARVQLYIRSTGCEENIVNQYTWTQRMDTAWIRAAVSAALADPAPGQCASADCLREAWIRDQLDYHRRSIKKTGRRLILSRRISAGVLIAMVLSFFLVLILEYFFPEFMVGTVWLTLLPQGWLKVLWGLISAVTVFTSSYLGKLSLERKSEDHERMLALFQTADDCYDRFPQNRKQLFHQLAQEELIESGNWYSYMSENKPSFDL